MKNFIFTTFVFLFFVPFVWTQNPVLIKDIAPGASGSTTGAISSNFVLDSLYFFMARPTQNQPDYWVTDGSADGTRQLIDIVPDAIDTTLPVQGNYLFRFDNISYFFVSYDKNHIGSIYRTDGTTNGTYLFKSGCGMWGSHPQSHAFINGKALFTGLDSHGEELWITDGTTANTKLLKDLKPGPASGNPRVFMNFKDRVYFVAEDTLYNSELWTTDGTSNGTYLLKDINNDYASSSYISFLGVAGDYLYFAAQGSNDFGIELWRTDGTQEGTVMAKDLNPGSGIGITCSFNAALDNKLIFSGFDPENGLQLWTSDGTNDGTHILKVVADTIASLSYYELVWHTDSFVLFKAEDIPHGRELWRTDGTENGTFLLKDMIEGPASGANSYDKDVAVYKNRVFFIGSDKNGRSQIWESDGTTAGTKQLTDLQYPIPLRYSLANLQVIGSYLFYTGPGNDYGSEVWKIQLDSQVATETPSASLQNFEIFPNPSEGHFQITGHLSFSTDLIATLCDLQGRVVANKRYEALDGHFLRSFEVGLVPNGLYWLNLQNATGVRIIPVSVFRN